MLLAAWLVLLAAAATYVGVLAHASAWLYVAVTVYLIWAYGAYCTRGSRR